MLPYKSLIQVERHSSLSLYMQVCNAFVSLIANGTLGSTDRLPGTRVLAELIGINRHTVKLAYEELISQGWVESIERRGVFVSARLPVLSKSELFQAGSEKGTKEAFVWTNRFENAIPSEDIQHIGRCIDEGFPDVRLAPVDQLMREYRSISRKFYGKGFLKYGSSRGSAHLRESITNYLSGTRGIMVTPDNIMITKGSQMGIYLAAQLLLSPGDNIAVGLSNFLTADEVFRYAGANLIRIPVDENGMDMAFLETVLSHKTIKAVYIIPHHHCPTTVTTSVERRLQLLELAREHRFAIIEDDYDFDFHYENKPYLPLASIDQNQNVVYVGSITKTFAPAMRIGFMVGSTTFIQAASALRQLVDRQGDTLMEEAFAVMFDDGEMDRHFRKSMKIYKQRRNLFCEILHTEFSDKIEFLIPEGGLAVWANFDPRIDLLKMSENALKSGLYISNGNFSKNESFQTNGVRMGFASLRESEMVEALDILKKVIR
jgi:GntR family transcriptional regulator/MocR family aminotransferase